MISSNSRAARPRQGYLARLCVAAAAFVALAWIPAGFDVGFQFDAALALVWGFSLLSIVLITGYVGQVSLCQATFAGVAAYAAGMMVSTFHTGYLVGIGVGVLAAFVLGILVGLPALRLHGITLAIVTLGIALVFDRYVFQDQTFQWLTGGSGGWRVDGASLFGIRMDSSSHLVAAYEVLLVLFCLTALLMVNMHQSGAGRRFRAIRDSELAAATMGVNLTRYKLLAFGLSAAIAGLGGSFYPLVAGSVSPQPFWVFTSLQLAAIAVLMGVRYAPAAALGGFFMAFVPDILTRNGHGTFLNKYTYDISYDWFQIAVGILLIAQLILLPDGIWGDLRGRALRAWQGVRTHDERQVTVA
jgi:branched-chain amino acid transport system permease protein